MTDPARSVPDAQLLRRIAENALQDALAKGGGGPHDPGMEMRVAKLETDVGEIKDILRRLEPVISRVEERLRKIEVDTAEAKGRLAGLEGMLRQAPTVWTLGGLVVAIFGLAFALLRFGMPH